MHLSHILREAEDLQPRGKKIYIAILSVLLLSFLFSLAMWLVNYPGVRKVFIFNSLDTGALIVESRFLPKKPAQGNETLFVDELLLGPLTERCLPLFSDGTKSLSVFEKDGVFYANISAHALSELAGVENIKDGAELFQKNILWNFSRVKTVELYIDSKKAY